MPGFGAGHSLAGVVGVEALLASAAQVAIPFLPEALLEAEVVQGPVLAGQTWPAW